MARRVRTLIMVGLCSALGACSTEPTQSSKPAAPSVEHTDHAATAAPGAAALKPVSAPAGAKVVCLAPEDGATVTGPLVDGKVVVHVKMGTEGIEVKPAGEQIDGTGHHHIVVDGAGIPVGDAVPKDETHLHFGKGQTEADVPLTPGPHTLTLQFADGAHLSYGPQLANTIKFTVAAAP
ncbi:MAG: DUF4399 domain-containing protein [Myxococcales bacterium]